MQKSRYAHFNAFFTSVNTSGPRSQWSAVDIHAVKIQSAYEATVSNIHIKHLVSFILQSFVNSTLGFLMKEKRG